MTIIYEAPAAAKPANHRISSEAFWDRFTKAEATLYEVAAWGDPAATLAKQKDSADLRIFRNQVNANGYVILGRTKVQTFLTSLESPMNGTTILAAGRANAILSAAITDEEAF